MNAFVSDSCHELDDFFTILINLFILSFKLQKENILKKNYFILYKQNMEIMTYMATKE